MSPRVRSVFSDSRACGVLGHVAGDDDVVGAAGNRLKLVLGEVGLGDEFFGGDVQDVLAGGGGPVLDELVGREQAGGLGAVELDHGALLDGQALRGGVRGGVGDQLGLFALGVPRGAHDLEVVVEEFLAVLAVGAHWLSPLLCHVAGDDDIGAAGNRLKLVLGEVGLGDEFFGGDVQDVLAGGGGPVLDELVGREQAGGLGAVELDHGALLDGQALRGGVRGGVGDQLGLFALGVPRGAHDLEVVVEEFLAVLAVGAHWLSPLLCHVAGDDDIGAAGNRLKLVLGEVGLGDEFFGGDVQDVLAGGGGPVLDELVGREQAGGLGAVELDHGALLDGQALRGGVRGGVGDQLGLFALGVPRGAHDLEVVVEEFLAVLAVGAHWLSPLLCHVAGDDDIGAAGNRLKLVLGEVGLGDEFFGGDVQDVLAGGGGPVLDELVGREQAGGLGAVELDHGALLDGQALRGGVRGGVGDQLGLFALGVPRGAHDLEVVVEEFLAVLAVGAHWLSPLLCHVAGDDDIGAAGNRLKLVLGEVGLGDEFFGGDVQDVLAGGGGPVLDELVGREQAGGLGAVELDHGALLDGQALRGGVRGGVGDQ